MFVLLHSQRFFGIASSITKINFDIPVDILTETHHSEDHFFTNYSSLISFIIRIDKRLQYQI